MKKRTAAELSRIGKGLGMLLCWGVCLFFGTSDTFAQIQPANWPMTLPKRCRGFLNPCYDSCAQRYLRQKTSQGNALFSPRSIRRICRQSCWSKPTARQLCRRQERVQGIQGMPAVEWPSGLSSFCLRFLHHCYVGCFRRTFGQQNRRGHVYSSSKVGLFCRRICWKHPGGKQLCRLQKRTLLRRGSRLLRRYEQQLRLAEKQDRIERRRLERERKEAIAQQRREIRLRVFEAQRQYLEKQRIRREQRELTNQRQELLQLKSQIRQSTAQKSKERREILEEKKQLALQRKRLEEERLRLLARKKNERSRQAKESQRFKQEQRRLDELKRLREQQLQELERLKQQRLTEQKRLKQLQSVQAREQQIAEEKRVLAQKKEEARLQRRKAELQKLQRKQEQMQSQLQELKSQKTSLIRQQKNFQQQRKQGQQRIAALRQLSQKAHQKSFQGGGVNQGQQLFNSGKLPQAKSWFSRKGKRQKVTQVSEFSQEYRKGTNAHQTRRPDDAIPALERSLTLDVQVGGGASIFTPRVRLMLGNMFIAKGLLAMSRKYYPSAFIYFKTARKYRPKASVIRTNVQRLRKVAEGYYQQAQAYKSADPRRYRQFLRKVVRIVPRDSNLYQKAMWVLSQ